MDEIEPALSPAQWTAVLQRADHLAELRAGFGNMPFSAHALAAILLYEQPFGFTAEDARDEREVAAYCDSMAAKLAEAGDDATAGTFRELAGKHRVRAAKIAALLPPEGVGEEARGEEESEGS